MIGKLFNIRKLVNIVKNKIVIHGLKNRGKKIRFSYGLEIKGKKYISIGNNVYGGKNFRIHAWDSYGKSTYIPEVSIGNNVSFGNDNYISCINKISIGDGVLVGDNVFFGDNSHGKTEFEEIIPIARELFSKGPIEIGNNVWIGRNVTILANVKIGNGVIIGASSVVNKSFRDDVVICGSPAVVVKKISKFEKQEEVICFEKN